VRINKLKQTIIDGNVGFGGIISGNSPEIVELLGAIGYDFVMIDCEHGPMDVAQVENMVRAAEAFNITPLARIPDHSDTTILRFLDRGIQGIIVPHVNTGEQAESIARAARYYPEGHRGVGGGRSTDYGMGGSREESAQWINSSIMVIPMIEEVEAIENLDDILAVKGIDMLHVVSGDLSQSMGYPGQDVVWKAMDDVVKRTRESGKFVSVGGNSPTGTKRVANLINQGVNAITIGTLGLLSLAAQRFREEVGAQ